MQVLIDRVSPARAPAPAAPAPSAAAAAGHDITEELLEGLYAAPVPSWLRVNMVGTVDGSATGEDGLTGSVNNPADRRVFRALRRLADGIVVGAGTARAEGYRPTDRPTVVVSRRGDVPERLRGGPTGSVLLVTCRTAEALAEAREVLGPDQVLVLGDHSVDLASLRAALAMRGLVNLLSEGGPHLLRDLLAARAVDELCATVVPRLVAGDGPRIAAGPALDVPVDLRLLLEEDGTLLGRWFVAS